MDEQHLKKIADFLLTYSRSVTVDQLFPAWEPEASEFARNNPYAFLIACSLDRLSKAETIWSIPYGIMKDLGHLDPFKIHRMTIRELEGLISRLPRKPYLVSAAPNTIKDLTRIVVEDYNGDAAGIWIGKKASEVKRTLVSIYGIGEFIANMALLLIECVFR